LGIRFVTDLRVQGMLHLHT